MARKPRDYDAELQALMDRAKKVKTQKTVQLGELVQIVGADALPIEALAGALLSAVEQSKKQPEAVASAKRQRQDQCAAKEYPATGSPNRCHCYAPGAWAVRMEIGGYARTSEGLEITPQILMMSTLL